MFFQRLALGLLVFLLFSSPAFSTVNRELNVERHNGCALQLESIAESAVVDVAHQFEVSNADRFVPEVAVRTAREKVSELVKAHTAQIQELEELGAEVKACKREGSCLVRVGKRLVEKVKLISKVIHTIFQTENTVRADLIARTESFAEQWLNQNQARPEITALSTEEQGELQVLITDELKSKIQGKRFSILAFYKNIAAHFTESFKALSFRAVRTDPVARTDLFRNLATVLSIQFGAQVLHNLKDFLAGQIGGFTSQLWIYGNTSFMMSLQAEVGARNQRRIEEPLEIHNFSQTLEELPNILIGEQGFWRDTQRKLMGFLALLPLEFSVTVAAKCINVAAQQGPGALLENNQLAEIGLVNLVSTAIFGTYLSLRWSLLDKWFYLNMLPSLRATTTKAAEEKLAALKTEGLVPDHWTEKDLYRAATASERPWWRFWQRPSKSAREDLTLNPEAFETLFLTEEAKAFVEEYKTSKGAARFEWAWRYGVCLIDSFIIFGLFGKWIPALVDYFGFF